MTAGLIESTSIVVPTLRETAIGEWQQYTEAHDAEQERRASEEASRKIDVLRMHLRDKFGIGTGYDVEVSRCGSDLRATVEGVVFSLRELPYADSFRDRDQLHVLVPCSRGCGKDLWMHVDSLQELGGILQPDATNTHSFPCLQQFDENGDPVTDTQGNPLQPRLPVEQTLTSVENARASIAAIDAAASWVADALNTIARLEDERALIKPEAIRRIMESRGIAATPAEKMVEADPEYAAHRGKQRDAEVVKWAAAAAYESAKLTAKLDVALATRGAE